MIHAVSPPFQRSEFGRALTSGSGIEELMEDLGHAMAAGGSGMLMLGGGNPGYIPEIEKLLAQRMRELVADPVAFRRMLGNYDPPRGNTAFLEAFAAMLRRELGWDIGAENLAVVCGGQTAFFQLFNLLAGRARDGATRRILFPLAPEYIGYASQGLVPGMFRALAPEITTTGPHEFKYHVDFDRLEITPDVAALCCSRPTNPSGNVLDDSEVARLSELARAHGIPLILDNAYGLPFPGIVYRDAQPAWDSHHILVMSLSKFGLPGTRTAIVAGPPEIARAIASMTAITTLSNGTIGQAMVLPWLEDDTLIRLSRTVIRGFYAERLALARDAIGRYFPADRQWALHETQGAPFLWLWLEGCSMSSREVYELLKSRGVLVVPGDYFFFGLDADGPDWPHRRECLRISYAMAPEIVEQGLEIIGRTIAEVARPFQGV